MDAKILKTLGDALQSPSFRKSFEHDPVGTMKDKGIDANKLDSKILDLLADMSSAELKALGNLSRKAAQAGIKTVAGDTYGGLFF